MSQIFKDFICIISSGNLVESLFGDLRLAFLIQRYRWIQISFHLLTSIQLCQKSRKILFKLFKCNLLSVMCLLGSILSSCEKNEIFLSLQISSRRIFTSFSLLFHSSSLETMPDTVTVLLLFLKTSLDLLWPLQSNWLYLLFLNSLCLYLEQYDLGLCLIKLVSNGLSYS